MSRIDGIAPEAATGKAKELLDAVKGKLGFVPNMTRAMANAPAALEGYLQFNGSLSKGSLSAKNREQIALVVAQANTCDYCLAAHSAIGKIVGLTPDQIRDSRRSSAVDPKSDALVRFARNVVDHKGRITARTYRRYARRDSMMAPLPRSLPTWRSTFSPTTSTR